MSRLYRKSGGIILPKGGNCCCASGGCCIAGACDPSYTTQETCEAAGGLWKPEIVVCDESANCCYEVTIASNVDHLGGVTATITTDCYGDGNGTTLITRFYDGSVVISVPATAYFDNFVRWLKNGANYSTNTSITITVDSDNAGDVYIACYGTESSKCNWTNSNPNGNYKIICPSKASISGTLSSFTSKQFITCGAYTLSCSGASVAGTVAKTSVSCGYPLVSFQGTRVGSADGQLSNCRQWYYPLPPYCSEGTPCINVDPCENVPFWTDAGVNLQLYNTGTATQIIVGTLLQVSVQQRYWGCEPGVTGPHCRSDWTMPACGCLYKASCSDVLYELTYESYTIQEFCNYLNSCMSGASSCGINYNMGAYAYPT